MTTRVILTGATGFIGKNLLETLIDRDIEVIAIRRQGSLGLPPIINEKVTWISSKLSEVSLTDIAGCEGLIHLAASGVQYPHDSLSNCIEFNVIEPLGLFRSAVMANVRCFIAIGSCFEYGVTGDLADCLTTKSELLPNDDYSISKACASMAFQRFGREHNINLDILRLFHVYGKGENPKRLWPQAYRAACRGEDFEMSMGEQIRDFIDVKDVCEIIYQRLIMERPKGGSVNVYNVGSGKAQSVYSFISGWWKRWNATGEIKRGMLPYRRNDVMKYIPGPDMLTPERSV